jgi:hypothetical protein
MVVFMSLGLLFTLWGNATLFDVVAGSGTASMFLDPILIIGLIVGRTINIWAYLVAFLQRLWVLWLILIVHGHG